MNKLSVVLFCDGRPGHEKQSRGVLQALQNYVDLDIKEIIVERLSVWQQVKAHVGYFVRLMRRSKIRDKVDLCIGTGSHTHIPLLSFKGGGHARAVTCMTPSPLLRKHFDLCFIPVHDRVQASPNIFETIGPPNLSKDKRDHDERRHLILIGGEDFSSHFWDHATILDSIKILLDQSADILWTISSSPRTPVVTENCLKEFVSGYEKAIFIPFEITEPGWIEDQYMINKVVWITGDSISMVYEALTAGCNVGLLPVKWKKKNNKFQYSQDYLINEDKIMTFDRWSRGFEFPQKDNVLLNEADRCAQEILRRWWPANLP